MLFDMLAPVLCWGNIETLLTCDMVKLSPDFDWSFHV